MWIQYLLVPIPMAMIWVILTNQISLASFVIGYFLGFGITLLVARDRTIPLTPAKIPLQVVALFVYSGLMMRDILLSGVDVALRVIGIRPLRTGIIAVPILDEDESDVIAGASAHSITITPGQLVVDFDKQKVMYVHCLDVDMFEPNLERQQVRRLRAFRRILGRD